MKSSLMVAVAAIAMLVSGAAYGAALPDAPSVQHKFWTVERFSVTAALIGESAYDGLTTQDSLSKGGHEMNPLAIPFVKHGAAGQAAASIVGVGSVLALEYGLHRFHHDRAADWVGRLAAAGEGVNCLSQGLRHQ